ncbi:6-phosphogluconate dehydrogenase C-terminal domain-like protein, partial [Vararia minispora EC-137]
AIGAFYAYILERSGKARITAVCRSNYDIVSRHGLEIVSDMVGLSAWKPSRVVRNVTDAADRKYRFVICAAKAVPDVVKTSDLLKPLFLSTQTFVLIQNGVNIHVDLQEACPEAHIITSCAWVDSTIIDGRKILQTGSNQLVSGLHRSGRKSDGVGEESLRVFHDMLNKGGGRSVITDDIVAARWHKVLWNAAISSVCTATRSPVCDLLCTESLPTMLPVLETLMKEVCAVAEQLADDAPAGVLEECLRQYSDSRTETPSTFKPSMLVDLEADRPMEVEVIVGNVVRAARSFGIATPR